MFERCNQSRHRTAVSCLLLLVLVYLPVSGAASHYCFDGSEPPVSVHFDYFAGHVDHEETGHIDLEKQLLDDKLVGKLLVLDWALPTPIRLPRPQAGTSLHTKTIPSPDLYAYRIWLLHSPLRAPPYPA